MITISGSSLQAPLRHLFLAVWILALLWNVTAFAQEKTPAAKQIGKHP